ncbi:hypothetical protein [Streptomyces sp. SID3343]|uniref:SWIM zinc finger family protein n=1 Tax=Streptomyces sp. SID3343 TaxID=2690260 RepID=UPI001369E00B|nr:hypothetical protein [Streptomyces sp. SID3343]MYV98256.1 hypothetical protein [Streptomyces sp. SID3343]
MSPFTEQDLLDAAGPKSFKCGESYVEAVVNLAEDDPGIVTASVEGTDTYSVVLEYEANNLTGECDCPYGDQGYFCKHCVATGLVYLRSTALHPVDTDPTEDSRRPPIDLHAYLGSLDRDELVTLLHEAADRDPALRRRLTLRAARTDAGSGPDITSIRDHLNRSLRAHGHLDRHGARTYAGAVADIAETLTELHAAGHHAAVVDLAGRALTLIGAGVAKIDDYDSGITVEGETLVELHAEACLKASTDPIELADWLLAFQLANHEWPELRIRDYAEPLGDAGMTHYAGRLEAVPQGGPPRWLIRHLRQCLANTRKNTDARVKALADDLTHGHTFVRIADVLTTTGRAEEGLAWAQRGFAEHPNDAELADYLTRRHTAAGRHDETLKIRWDQFHRQPTRTRYQHLLEAAHATGELDHYRTKALQTLRDAAAQPPTAVRASHDLIDILLAENLIDDAWQAAETFGADRPHWLRLAEARQPTHPATVIPIYLREAVALIKTANPRSYAHAAALLTRARTASQAANREPEWQQELTNLRTEHHRKRNLLTELTRRGLT